MPHLSRTQENFSIPSGGKVKRVHPTSWVYLRSHSPIPDSSGVSLIATSPPQGEVPNAKFHQSIHVIAQMVAAQAEQGATGALSVEAIRVGQFMKMSPFTFLE